MEQVLYSILLSKDNVRMIYINQTIEDIESHRKNNTNCYITVVKQAQDKGIQIIIKD